MESLSTFMDDLLDFSSDIGEDEDEDENPKASLPSSSSLPLVPEDRGRSPEEYDAVAEEELEWLSNKDAFPEVETFVGILSENPDMLTKHHSPVSVLENSNSNSSVSSNNALSTMTMSCCNNLQVPVKARSIRKRRRRKNFAEEKWSCVSQKGHKTKTTKPSTTMGRKCLHCQAEKTPQWRAGPMGPKTLCNACGVRYKSGRLVPEYRPACSPTFSSLVHSNSHRKIMEMRKQKQRDMGFKNVDTG
ncbi:Zinc finger, GATA-type [Dillenia turbinata]|uniref:Zinc finger, GATA-type n=1 Tax=Dillenia turbinata TaxID=194707 RepID=A0AAN8UEZ9_9MAGN